MNFTSEAFYMVYTLLCVGVVLTTDRVLGTYSQKHQHILYPISIGIWASLLSIVFHTLLEISTKISTCIAGATLAAYFILVALTKFAYHLK